MGKEHNLFKDFLDRLNLKFTPQRRAILDAVFDTHRHFDAEELVDILKANKRRISRATVYRTLDLLVESGLVRAMDLGDSRRVFEHVIGHKHHDHLICTECGKTIEFDDGLIEMMQQKVCDRLNFSAKSHSLRIFGWCADCRQRVGRFSMSTKPKVGDD